MSEAVKEHERLGMLANLRLVEEVFYRYIMETDALAAKYGPEAKGFSFQDWVLWLDVRASLRAIAPVMVDLIHRLETANKKEGERR